MIFLSTGVPDPLHFDTDPDPALFWRWLSRCQQKMIFCKDFFLISYCWYANISLQDAMSLRSHKTVKSWFISFFCLLMERSGSVKKHTDHTSVADPDPGFGAFLTPESGNRDG